MNNDQLKGRLEEAKGRFKEVIGKIINDKEMELEGNAQKISGKAKASWGDIQEVIKNSRPKTSVEFIVKPRVYNSENSISKYVRLFYYRRLK